MRSFPHKMSMLIRASAAQELKYYATNPEANVKSETLQIGKLSFASPLIVCFLMTYQRKCETYLRVLTV